MLPKLGIYNIARKAELLGNGIVTKRGLLAIYTARVSLYSLRQGDSCNMGIHQGLLCAMEGTRARISLLNKPA